MLTVRPAGDHVHAGQVALPGGKREPGDEFPTGTALREAAEEIGLDPAGAGVRTLGTLGTIDVRVSGFLMVPVLAVAATRARAARRPARGGRAPARARADVPARAPPSSGSRRSATAGICGTAPTRSRGTSCGVRPARVLGQLGSVLGGARARLPDPRGRAIDRLPGLPFGLVVLLGRPGARRQGPAGGLHRPRPTAAATTSPCASTPDRVPLAATARRGWRASPTRRSRPRG